MVSKHAQNPCATKSCAKALATDSCQTKNKAIYRCSKASGVQNLFGQVFWSVLLRPLVCDLVFPVFQERKAKHTSASPEMHPAKHHRCLNTTISRQPWLSSGTSSTIQQPCVAKHYLQTMMKSRFDFLPHVHFAGRPHLANLKVNSC